MKAPLLALLLAAWCPENRAANVATEVALACAATNATAVCGAVCDAYGAAPRAVEAAACARLLEGWVCSPYVEYAFFAAVTAVNAAVLFWRR